MGNQATAKPLDVSSLTLEAFAEYVWSHLAGALQHRDHPFRMVTLATRGLCDEPRVRSVVLRHLERSTWTLGCHTDVRSPKVAELERDARSTWLFYDRAVGLQVRVRARTNVHHGDALARSDWEQTAVYSRACYMGPLAPSLALDVGDDPASAVIAGAPPEEGLSGRQNFAVLRAQIESLDCLYLSAAGHRRMQIDIGAEGEARRWLAP